jgi:hypothetical protein
MRGGRKEVKRRGNGCVEKNERGKGMKERREWGARIVSIVLPLLSLTATQLPCSLGTEWFLFQNHQWKERYHVHI